MKTRKENELRKIRAKESYKIPEWVEEEDRKEKVNKKKAAQKEKTKKAKNKQKIGEICAIARGRFSEK